MAEQPEQTLMEKIVSLCKRRGILFQSSEIYNGLQGFWDYGPVGVELKRNVKEAWWRDMVTGHDDLSTLPGAPCPFEMCGLDCAIITDDATASTSIQYFIGNLLEFAPTGARGISLRIRSYRLQSVPQLEAANN